MSWFQKEKTPEELKHLLKQVNINKEKIELEAKAARKEIKKLKIELEDSEEDLYKAKEKVGTLKRKIDSAKETIDGLRTERNSERDEAVQEMEKNKAALRKRELQIENDGHEKDMEIKELKAKIARLDSQRVYDKDLISQLREFPEIKNAIKNLQELSVPGINELKEFGKMIQGNADFKTVLEAIEDSRKSGQAHNKDLADYIIRNTRGNRY